MKKGFKLKGKFKDYVDSLCDEARKEIEKDLKSMTIKVYYEKTGQYNDN